MLFNVVSEEEVCAVVIKCETGGVMKYVTLCGSDV